jgi:carboxypeptidase D
MAVGIYFFCRQRRRRLPVAPESTLDLEETIPLRRRQEEMEYHDTELNMDRNDAKATETVFEVGDSDGEENYNDSKRV